MKRFTAIALTPRLLGKASTPRDWVHIQDYEKRHIRSRDDIYPNAGQLQPIVKIWEEPAQPIKQPFSAEERAAIEQLKNAFRHNPIA